MTRNHPDFLIAKVGFLYETTNLSYKAIGESFGKDHTTVLHNVRCIENFLRDKPYQKELVDDIIKNLKSDNTAY